MLLTVNINALKIVWACLLKFRSCSLMVTDNKHALKITFSVASYLDLVPVNCLVTLNTHALKLVWTFLLTFCSCSLLLIVNKHPLKFIFSIYLHMVHVKCC